MLNIEFKKVHMELYDKEKNNLILNFVYGNNISTLDSTRLDDCSNY